MTATPNLNPITIIDCHSMIDDQEKYGNFDLNGELLLNNLVFDSDSDNNKQISPVKISTHRKEPNVKQSKRSTIQRQTVVSPTKLNLLKAMGIDFEVVPDYLSKTNPSFERKVHSILPSTINVEELREIALLMYKLISLDIVHSLWIVYQKSGMGDLQPTLTIKQVDMKIWPPEVQSYMKLSKFQSDNNEDNSQDRFVNHCLHQLDNQSKEYRHQLNMKTSHLIGYTRSLEYIIEKFVQQGLISKRTEIDRDIALVQYHYTDIELKSAYLTQNPNEHQIQIVKRLCILKYDQEMTKHEAKFVKQQIPIYIASHQFEKQPIAQFSLINNIHDSVIRQQLYKQYKETVEQARTKMMSISLECAEAQRDRYQQRFNVERKQIFDGEKTLPIEQKITSMMWNLIDQRLANITARIECLYKFKIQLLQIKSNI